MDGRSALVRGKGMVRDLVAYCEASNVIDIP